MTLGGHEDRYRSSLAATIHVRTSTHVQRTRAPSSTTDPQERCRLEQHKPSTRGLVRARKHNAPSRLS